MDVDRFDHLTRWLSAGGNRRRILALLTSLPLGGLTALQAGDVQVAAKRRKQKAKQRKRQSAERKDVDVDALPHKKRCRRVKGKGQGHHGRRKNCQAHHGGNGKDKGKNKAKDQPCEPESLAQTCAGTCGSVQNNCQQAVDCGSCACNPPCPVCQTCNEVLGQCQPDLAQDSQTCAGCQICDNGQCVPDPAIVCAALTQCHEAGVCDPATGACTNPAKANGASCDDGNSCTTDDACQDGVCIGTPKDCAAEGDVCNDPICRTDGTCGKNPKPDGTSCNADNDSCTSGDSCQAGVCTAGAGVDCSTLDDGCNTGSCRSSNGQCISQAKADGTLCGTDGACLAGVCQAAVCREIGDTCNPAACCTNRVPASCVSGECCVLEGQYCEEDGDCCTGTCPDGFCQGCLPLQAECESATECCQSSGSTLCRNSFDFDSANCCKPRGGTCSENDDCCNGRACNNGRCCEGENFLCDSNADCCSGLECRSGICRSNICRVAGEGCPGGSSSCCPGSGTCSGGRCCHQVGQACEQAPLAGNPCCGSETECGGADGATCCLSDFAGVFGGEGDCASNDQCCSGYCHSNGVCCRPQGASCSQMGALNFECCPYLGLTCNANGAGTCIPCGKLGQACVSDGSDSTCCIGSYCDSGVCKQDSCGIGGSPCQDSSTCCAGHFCTAGGACLRSCQAEGESCGPLGSIFPCCSGLTCDDPDRGTCRRA